MTRRRPQSPPDVTLVPGTRQLVVGRKAITLQSAVPKTPKWRRGGESNKEGEIRDHRLHDCKTLLSSRKLNMDVHAAKHVTMTYGLEIFNHGLVARLRAWL